ncbi:hypothetical protein DLM75_17195 [Leptospira stimsonii]|uniref:Uncharacterized protein n=1 Tax=Leptospira stimsonii TaxID=2202203 RepID=A0A396YVJ5_9LEPT|nr:hypothetical protein DLM75_17195 [Leptospira stimsonii]
MGFISRRFSKRRHSTKNSRLISCEFCGNCPWGSPIYSFGKFLEVCLFVIWENGSSHTGFGSKRFRGRGDRRKLLESVSSYFFLHQESPLAKRKRKRKSRNSHVSVSSKNLSRKGIPFGYSRDS